MADTHKLVVRVPGLPDGEPVEVLFLGLHPNGTTVNLNEEQVALYEDLNPLCFPKSGYIIAGEPKTDAEKKAAEDNVKEQEAARASSEPSGEPSNEPTPDPSPTPTEGGN